MSEKLKNIEKLEDALTRIESKENAIYFLCYDTKGNPRASVKHIYDMALYLKQAGMNSKILVEDSKYSGVSAWLGDSYNEIPVVSIKEDKINTLIQHAFLWTNISNAICIKN